MQATKETELLKVSVVPRRARCLMKVISRAKCVVLISSNDKDGINLETNLARQLIPTPKSPSSFSPTCKQELFLISLKIVLDSITSQLPFSCVKPGSNCCQMSFKTPEEDKEETGELPLSLAAAKEICLCCRSCSFV